MIFFTFRAFTLLCSTLSIYLEDEFVLIIIDYEMIAGQHSSSTNSFVILIFSYFFQSKYQTIIILLHYLLLSLLIIFWFHYITLEDPKIRILTINFSRTLIYLSRSKTFRKCLESKSINLYHLYYLIVQLTSVSIDTIFLCNTIISHA